MVFDTGPGIGLLKLLEYSVIREIKVSFVMLMVTFEKSLSNLSVEAVTMGTIQVLGRWKLSVFLLLNLPTSREGMAWTLN